MHLGGATVTEQEIVRTLRPNSTPTGSVKFLTGTCFELQELLIHEIKLSTNKANLMFNVLTALVLRHSTGRNDKMYPTSFAT